MNEPIIVDSATSAAAECCGEVDQIVRRNPGASLLVAIGAGLAIGLLVGALRPAPTPRRRLAELLEDFEGRLRSAAEPAMRKAGSLTAEGVSVLHDGGAGIERMVRGARKRFRNLFA
jgi:ElaB/YqjD/DUF883 family membrane-anchored ribosome-binding protein